MHGNVFEWCEDDWHDSYEGAPTDGSAWLNEKDSLLSLLRGSSWIYSSQNCRSAYRSRSLPDNSINFVGLRVVASSRT
jgi:formylglycine-generating enzyme required for sulfatase activity